jgi:hypothetical protein
MAEAQIPIPNVPIAGDKPVNREWRWFFHAMWLRSGGAGDVTALLAGDLGVTVQAWDADLDALAALAGTGLVVRTAAAAYVERTLTGPAAGISVSNGDGVAGNPTLALADDIAALEALGSTGIAVRTGANTWAQRTITAAGGAFWADGDGVSGNPTIDVALQVFEMTVGQADLASAAEKILLDAATDETWKVLDIVLSGDGTDFSGGGGDRLLDITDGTSTWSVIPAATLQSLAVARWGDAGMPNPATASHLFAASASGTDIVGKYSGGTTDYTAGSLTLRITAYRTA